MPDRIFELRNYTLRPGRRDELIELFEREFIESQEAVGAHILATFRDLDRPDHFVWLRGFADMDARLAALSAFYSGTVWKAHREAANATMIDTDDVYLLHAVGPPLPLPSTRPAPGEAGAPGSEFTIDIYDAAHLDTHRFEVEALSANDVIAAFETEHAPNTFPQLPVRADSVFVTLRRAGPARPEGRTKALPRPARTLRLRPTARSLLR